MNRKLLWLLASVWSGVTVAAYTGVILPGEGSLDAVVLAQLVTVLVAPFIYALQALDADRASLVTVVVMLPVGGLYYGLCAWLGLPVWVGVVATAMYAVPVGVLAGVSTWTWDYWHRYEVTANEI